MSTRDTIPSRLFAQAERRPNAPAYYVREGGRWTPTTYRAYVAEVRLCARAMLAAGVEPGGNVCILGFNRPEWVVADLACMALGGAPAGIYTTCSPAEVRYIVDHTEAKLVVVENEEQWRKIDAERANLPHLRKVVMMRGAPAIDDPLCVGWDAFLDAGKSVDDGRVDDLLEALKPQGLATLIYTSGTTGPPKGVMLSHENLAWTAKLACDLVNLGPDDCALSYLPLSHIAEQVFSIHAPITAGGQVYFAESIDALPDNLKEVQPTVFFAVPRVWEKFHSGISAKLREAKGAKKRLVEWAMDVAGRVTEERSHGREPSLVLSAQHRLADKLIFQKLKPAIGLGRARVCVTGAAPIAKELLDFFARLDVLILEVYGQSEDTGPTSFNLPHRFRLGTVGPTIPGAEVAIADDGEILVKGPNVFIGYYKDEAATKETLIDGWLQSGDLGSIDREGFLHITGRKKDIIITAGGKNITPKNIESALKNHYLINEAVVIGDRRKYLTALVTVDPDAAEKLARERGINGAKATESEVFVAEVQHAVDDVNRELARVEQIKKFRILPRNLTVEDGELTPTLKVKRRIVNENFADEIESMYAD